jgi:uncharacterized protein (TIGR02117 family)
MALLRKWRWRFGVLAAGVVLLYAGFLLLGFVPVNRNYKVPPSGDRVMLFVRSNEIHTDIVMPIVHEPTGIDWRKLFAPEDCLGDVSGAEYVAAGWGNRGFFIEIERWADLKVSTLLKAIFPSESVLHVEYLDQSLVGGEMRKIVVSHQDYLKLAEFVKSSVGRIDKRGFAQLATETSYNDSDRFYMASGSYHAFNTCNQWTGRGLKLAGVPIGIWTPLKQQVLFWLPREKTLEQAP